MNVSSKLTAAVLVGVTLFVSRHRILDLVSTKKAPAALSQQGTCLGKKMCAVVYVAPWCPACHAIEGDLRMLGTTSGNHPEFGVVIIVGGGRTADENEAKVAEFGTVAVADNKNTYAESLRIRKYPSFLVTRIGGDVIHEDEAAIKWMDESFGFSL